MSNSTHGAPTAAGAVFVLVWVASCAASPVLTLSTPDWCTPGSSFDLEVLLAGAEDLRLFNIELELAAEAGTPGVDFYFVGAEAPAARYVFDGHDPLGFVGTVLDDARHRITLSDLILSGGADTVAGVNDSVAKVTVGTSPGMIGALTVTVIADSLELDRPDGQPIAGFDALAASLPTAEVLVPEPCSASLSLAALGMLLLRARRRAGPG